MFDVIFLLLLQHAFTVGPDLHGNSQLIGADTLTECKEDGPLSELAMEFPFLEQGQQLVFLLQLDHDSDEAAKVDLTLIA